MIRNTEGDRRPVAMRLPPIPPGMLAGALVRARSGPPIADQVSPVRGRRSGSGLGSRESVAGRRAALHAAARYNLPPWIATGLSQPTGPTKW